MAGRIRTIKPELLEDAATSGLTSHAFRLFVALILLADDHGNARAGVSYLRAQAFHSAPDAPTNIEPLLRELTAKLVIVYSVGGEDYVHIRGWARHQRISNAGEPRVPIPPGWTLELYTRQEGNRTRQYARSMPGKNGAAPTASQQDDGAAPISSRSHVEENGAAGSPISDHDLRSPITTGGLPATPPPALSESESAVVSEIAHFNDLWPRLRDGSIERAAVRIARVVATEPACKRDGLDAATVARMSLPKVREWAAGATHSTEAQRLARVETEVGWMLGRVRKGWHRVEPVRVAKGAATPVDSAELWRDQAESEARIEREKREAALRRKADAPRVAANVVGDALAKLKAGA